MQDYNSMLPAPKPNRIQWNKGKLIGAKPLLMARQHVWSIRTIRLQIDRRIRDIAMFNYLNNSDLMMSGTTLVSSITLPIST
jgi:hypothetical protein